MPDRGKPRPKRRRWLKVLLVLAICLVAGWFVLDYFVLDVDRYRPMIVKAIEKASGLPASLESIDLVLFPKPHLFASQWSIGEGDFKVTLEHGEIHAQIMPLFRRELVIETIVLDGLVITTPEGVADLRTKVVTFVENLNAADKGVGESAITLAAIEMIRAEQAEIYVGDSESPVAVLTVEVSDSVSDHITVSLETTLPQYGDTARFESDLVIELDSRTKALTSITGTGQLEALQLARAFPVEGAPEAELGMSLEIEGVDQNDLTVQLDGVLTSQNPALDGTFSTAIRWQDGALAVDDLEWEAPGVRLAAGGTRDADGDVTLSIHELSVKEGAFDTLLEMAQFGAVHLEARPGAWLSAAGVEVELEANGYPDFHAGVIRFEGVDAVLDTDESVSTDIHAEVEIEEGALLVNNFAGDGFSLAGSILRDREAASVAVDVRGHVELSPALLAVFGSTPEVTDIGGTVHVDTFKATFTEQPVVPEDLVVAIRFTDGKLGIDSAGYRDRLEPLTAAITGDGMAIRTTVNATSQRLGDIELEGRLGIDAYQWEGTIAGDLQRVINAFLPDSERKRLDSILAQYGESRFAMRVDLPSGSRDELAITLEREGQPTLEGTVAFDMGGGGSLVLADINASAVLDAGKLDGPLIGAIVASGPAAIVFTRSQAQEEFSVRFDFARSTIQVGDYVTKREGDLLAVELTGEASTDSWAAHLVKIECLGEAISMDLSGERVRIDDLDVDLALLAPLLSEGREAHGRLRGAVAFGPLEAELQFENAGFVLKPDVGIDSIDGSVTLSEEAVAFREITVRGTNTDCRLDLKRENGVWDGTLSGAKLDLNPIMAVVDEVEALMAGDVPDESAEGDAASDDAAPLLGTFVIDLGELYYRRGRVDAFYLKVSADEDGIRYSEIAMQPHSGSITGTVFMPAAANESGLMDIDLVVSEVDLRDMDELLYDEPNVFYGIVTGTVDFTAPMSDGTIEMSGANGDIAWDVRDGSFGKLGLATQFLTVLKTVQIITLKVPSFRDEGLLYDEFVGKLAFRDGVMQAEDTALRSTAYAMLLTGGADFNTEQTDARVFVQVLESIGGVIRKIPVVGIVTKATTDQIGVIVNVSGSPYDPKFSVGSGSNIVNNVAGVGKGVVGLGVDSFKSLTGTLKNIFKKD